MQDPGGRVPANLTPKVLGIAREAFRRGIEQTVYTTYHAGQNAVHAYWMRTAFALSADPAVLRQAQARGCCTNPACGLGIAPAITARWCVTRRGQRRGRVPRPRAAYIPLVRR